MTSTARDRRSASGWEGWRDALAAAALILALGLVLTLAGSAASAQESGAAFRETGIQAFAEGRYPEAVAAFRHARFLTLEEPRMYLEILARLAVAEDASKLAAARDQTLDRFYTAESRFGEFRAASLEPDIRLRFFGLLQARYGRQQLLEVPTLAAELGLIPVRPTRREGQPSQTAQIRTPAVTERAAAAPREAASATPILPPTLAATKMPTSTRAPVPSTPTPTPRPLTSTPTEPATATPLPTPSTTPTTTRTPTLRATSTPTSPPPTVTASRTSTPLPPSATPTHPPPTATSSRTWTPTAPPPTVTSSRTRTAPPPTVTRTFTATVTPTARPTSTPTSSATPRPTSTPTFTATPRPTSTATPRPASTATETATARPTSTATSTATPRPISTATATAAPTAPPPTETRTRTPTHPSPTPPSTHTPTTRPAAPTGTPWPVRFIPADQVDVPPVPITQVNPIYPERALRERVRGLVILRVLVSEDGLPVRVSVEKAAREDLTKAAIEAAGQWRFQPARKDGRPVRTFTLLRFPFEGIAFARTPLPSASTPSPPTETPTPSRGQESWRQRTPRSE